MCEAQGGVDQLTDSFASIAWERDLSNNKCWAVEFPRRSGFGLTFVGPPLVVLQVTGVPKVGETGRRLAHYECHTRPVPLSL